MRVTRCRQRIPTPSLSRARSREDAAPVLFDEPYAFGLEPAAGVLGTEMMKCAFHQLETPRIDFPQVSDGIEGVGQVAAPAAGQRHLGKGLGTGLKYGHIDIRAPSFQFDGTQTAGRSGADDGQLRHRVRIGMRPRSGGIR